MLQEPTLGDLGATGPGGAAGKAHGLALRRAEARGGGLHARDLQLHVLRGLASDAT